MARGIINLLFNGGKSQLLLKTMSSFELNKLDQTKASFSLESLLDTIIRYKIKGSSKAKTQNNASEKNSRNLK